MASNLNSLPAHRTSRLQWRGTGIKVSQVLAQLSLLRAEAAREEALDQDNPHPRNSVMDLVVVASNPESAERAADSIARLAAHHPCRAVIVLDEPGDGESRIDAAVSSYSHQLIDCPHCQYEQVFLRVRGAAAEHIPSLVEALLVSDVTTYLWWTGSPPMKEARFRDSLGIANVLLVDSSSFEKPYENFVQLAELVSEKRDLSVGDLHWARIRSWRETVAQFFNPLDRRPYLRGIGAVGIDYVATGRGNRSAAALLAGWLAEGLGWRLKRAAGGAAGTVLAHYQGVAGHSVEVVMRPVEIKGLIPGEVTAVKVEAVVGGHTCSMQATRDPREPQQVTSNGTLGAVEIPRRSLAMPSLDEASLINQLLISARGDDVYRRALKAAAELKAALR